jgi:hypothetical protein
LTASLGLFLCGSWKCFYQKHFSSTGYDKRPTVSRKYQSIGAKARIPQTFLGLVVVFILRRFD